MPIRTLREPQVSIAGVETPYRRAP